MIRSLHRSALHLAVWISSLGLSLSEAHSALAQGVKNEGLPQGAILRLGSQKFRSTDSIWCIAFSAEGKALITGSLDRSIRVWEPLTGRELARFYLGKRHDRYAIASVAAHPTTSQIAVAGPDAVWLWDWTKDKQPRCFAPPLTRMQDKDLVSIAVTDVAFSIDGLKLACADREGTIRVWKLPTGRDDARLLKTLKLPEAKEYSEFAFSPDL